MSFRESFQQRKQNGNIKGGMSTMHNASPQARGPACARARDALANWKKNQIESSREEQNDTEIVSELVTGTKKQTVQITRLIEAQDTYIHLFKPENVNGDSQYSALENQCSKYKNAIFNARRNVLKLRHKLETSGESFERRNATNTHTTMQTNLGSLLDQLSGADNRLDLFQSQIGAYQTTGQLEKCHVTKPEEVASFVKNLTTRNLSNQIHRGAQAKEPRSFKTSLKTNNKLQHTREIMRTTRTGVLAGKMERQKETNESPLSLKNTSTFNDRKKKSMSRVLFSNVNENDGSDVSLETTSEATPPERELDDKSSMQANIREAFLKEQQPSEEFLLSLFESSCTILVGRDCNGLGALSTCTKGDIAEDHLMSQTEFLYFVHFLHILDIRIKHSTVNVLFEKVLHASTRSRKKFTKRIEFLDFRNVLKELAVMKYPHADELERFARLHKQFLIPYQERVKNVHPSSSSARFGVLKRLLELDVVQFLGEQHLPLVKLFRHFGTAYIDCQRGPNDQIHYEGDVLLNIDEWTQLWRELQPNEDEQQLQKIFESVAGRTGDSICFSQFLECLGIVALNNGTKNIGEENCQPMLPQLQFLFLDLDRDGSIFNMQYIAGRKMSQAQRRKSLELSTLRAPGPLVPAPCSKQGKTANFVIDLFMNVQTS